ncbi:BTB/POZ domain-containing protein KCTD9-like [Ruditapes philippinarum]|uniref:BTB/POZ domain-containing protein KCTD9-like n=1 Tax=Ruditapes philippinarum TaxID=129788 RepID=UPI00295BE255|nr:BTB/POZ domain-containing protein KCTD9-like [Ruditapes philippinarum]
MKRVVIFKNGRFVDGKVISVTHSSSMEDVLSDASKKLGFVGKKIYTPQGGLIDEVSLLRDDDVVYVSGGEAFKAPPCNHSCPADPHSAPCKVSQCSSGEWVTLNVGGTLFSTTRSTLTQQHPDSMLSAMFSNSPEESWCSSVDETGAYLIDRSARYFEPILNYLRHGQLILDKHISAEGVLEEAKFFGLTSLIETLEATIESELPAEDHTPINRREFVMKLLVTSTDKELRCQGMNFAGANLSKLDLRGINFKYAILKNANLSGANLSYCNFERSDLSRAVLDSANLLGVKMLCANMEGTSLKGCNFEDPAGTRANMEGALMKSVNLEGSHMAGVNLRVANLKNANLQNCDLRGAVLAGADLENCDLSGCDLQEANLRGANLKDAAFELMLNPLHMAQAVR